MASTALRVGAIFADVVGDRAEAEAWYRRSLELGNPEALNDLASFLSDDPSHWDEAAALYRAAIEIDDPLAPLNLGRLENDRENYVIAAQLIVECVAKGQLKALLPLAEAQRGLGGLDAAKATLQKACACGVADAHLALANFYADHPEVDYLTEVEEIYHKAIANQDDGATFHYALYLDDEDRLEEAINVYLQAIEDGSEVAYNNVGRLYRFLGDPVSAEWYLRRGIEEELTTAVMNYADLLAEQDRLSEISELITKARELECDTEDMAHLIALANGLT